jgi:hypothetical protein
VTSGSAIGSIDTQELKYEDQYYKDFRACTLELRDRVKAVGLNQELVSWVLILLTLPDPAPDLLRLNILVELGTQIRRIAAKEPKLARQILATFAKTLNMPEYMLKGKERT